MTILLSSRPKCISSKGKMGHGAGSGRSKTRALRMCPSLRIREGRLRNPHGLSPSSWMPLGACPLYGCQRNGTKMIYLFQSFHPEHILQKHNQRLSKANENFLCPPCWGWRWRVQQGAVDTAQGEKDAVILLESGGCALLEELAAPDLSCTALHGSA